MSFGAFFHRARVGAVRRRQGEEVVNIRVDLEGLLHVRREIVVLAQLAAIHGNARDHPVGRIDGTAGGRIARTAHTGESTNRRGDFVRIRERKFTQLLDRERRRGTGRSRGENGIADEVDKETFGF